jgi:hypothetical protein
MNLKEMNERDRKIQPELQYKLSHQWLLVYLGIVGVLLIAFCVLMATDEKRYLPVGIVLLALIALTMAAYLVAMVVVRRKVLENPEKKDGAKRPARIPISASAYKELRRQIAHSTLEKGRLDAYRFFFADQLMNADLLPALAVSVKPFTVAVYSDEFDGVLLLSFPEELAAKYDIRENARLTAVASYYEKPFARQGLQKDIFPGPNQTGKWMDLLPVLPAFLTEDGDLLKQKERELGEELWSLALSRIEHHLAVYPEFVRDGFWFTHLSSDDWDRNPVYEAQR